MLTGLDCWAGGEMKDRFVQLEMAENVHEHWSPWLACVTIPEDHSLH